MVLFLCILCTLLFSISNGQQQQSDTLLLNSSLPPGNTKWITSPKGIFFFGLISPSEGKWYLGISYNLVDDTNIWIANRETPAMDGPGVNFTSDGNVVLYDKKGVVWTSGTSNKRIVAARLYDSGNFALLNNKSEIVWQSFEHPSDTWMPGMEMKLGYKLVSWKSKVDPSPGRYSMTLRPTSEYVSLWNNSIQYWTSGVWNGVIFSNVPQIRADFIYNFTYINNSNTDQYFTWSEKAGIGNSSHFRLDVDGIIRVRIIQGESWYNIFSVPDRACAAERVCGPYGICNNDEGTPCSCPQGFQPQNSVDWNNSDWSSGCTPIVEPGCDARNVSFSSLPKSVTFNLSESSRSVPGMNMKSCQNMCIEDCSCVGFSFGSSCSIINRAPVNGRTSSSGSQDTVFLKVANIAPENSLTKSSRQRVVVIAVVASILGVLAIFSVIVVLIWCRRKPKDLSSLLVTSFTYKELQKATNNFSQKLGSGGFGAVFKGNLPGNNVAVAIKRLENMKQGEKEFHAEVCTLGMIQHINLVRLWGFCAEGSHRLLVYEYMEQGSLDRVLFGQTHLLNWNTRYNIALGTARALAYLHEECINRIIHCDIKPENILLDTDFSPKVSDFGLAKLLGRDVSRVITHMRGTRGYLAPEWVSNLPITTKADVYSYGMTLLEIVGGRRNIDVNGSLDKWHFPLWAFHQLTKGNIAGVPDERLGESCDMVQVERAVKVAMLCIQDTDELRPSMPTVLQMLEGTLEVPMPRMPETLQMMELPAEEADPHFVPSNSHGSNTTIADDVISSPITFLEGR